MNRIVLLGRLTKDPEVKYTNTGKVVCLFTLAVDRPYTNQQGQREADFINIVLWGKQAETFGNYFSKGQRQKYPHGVSSLHGTIYTLMGYLSIGA